MAASAKKKNKKGKTLTLTDFLAEDSSGNNPAPSYPTKTSSSWADETDDLDGDVSTSWHTEEDNFRAPAIDRSILPTAPRSAREPNIDRSKLPRSPPYTAFLGNLPYDVSEESIKDFFHGLAISAVRLPREPNNPERLKGFGYAEFDDVESFLSALSLSDENLGNRRIRVDIADQSNDKERDNGPMGGRDRGGRMENMGPDKTDSDWRARPSADDDGPPKRDDAFGERSRDRFGESDRFRDGPRRDNDRFGGGGGGGDRFRDRYDDRDRRDFDRGGFDSRGGSRRAFGSGFRRDYDDAPPRGSSDRYGGGGGDRDRFAERDDRFERRGGDDKGPMQRPKLNLKPRSIPKDDETSGGNSPAAPPPASNRSASIFGAAKPVDTAAREREVEERLKKEEERLQRQIEEDKGRGPDRKMRDGDPSWRNEENRSERSRVINEPSNLGGSSALRSRDADRAVDNEEFSGKEEEPSSPVSSPRPPPTNSSSKEPLKLVMPAPPPKENAWARRSATSTGSNEADGLSPVYSSGSTPPKLSSSSTEERGSGKDENKADGVRRERGPPRARGSPTGPSAGRGRGEGPNKDRRKEADRKDIRRDRDSRPPPEPKKCGETPTPKFSSASKYAALLMDGGDADETADVE